jgi:hypothetical protein
MTDKNERIHGIGILLEEGGEWPAWYGYAWRQSRHPYRAVCFPIPLNVLLGFPVAVYFWFKRPFCRSWK